MDNTVVILAVMFGAVLIIGGFFFSEYLPFAAMVGKLEDESQDTSGPYKKVDINIDSGTTSDLHYTIEWYGPNADEECYDSPVATTQHDSQGIVDIPDAVMDETGHYQIVVYPYDSGEKLELDNSAFDDDLYQNCLDNPQSYGVPEQCKESACHGAGWSFNVISEENGEEEKECYDDLDCYGDQVCENNVCVDPEEEDNQTDTDYVGEIVIQNE